MKIETDHAFRVRLSRIVNLARGMSREGRGVDAVKLLMEGFGMDERTAIAMLMGEIDMHHMERQQAYQAAALF